MEKKKTANYIILIKSVIATVITILMFYPLFGGTLTILNGTFVYFSYFLVVILLVVYLILEIVGFIQSLNKKNEMTKNRHEVKMQRLLFSYVSLIVIIGLLQARYIVQPLLGIIFIVVELFQLYRYIIEPSYQRELENFTVSDRIKQCVFFLTSITLLLGNQPFEGIGLPVATALLLLLDIITLTNAFKKQNVNQLRKK